MPHTHPPVLLAAMLLAAGCAQSGTSTSADSPSQGSDTEPSRGMPAQNAALVVEPNRWTLSVVDAQPQQTQQFTATLGGQASDVSRNLGHSCASGGDCCSGTCAPDPADPSGATTCQPPPSACVPDQGQCSVTADCCGASSGAACSAGRCISGLI